MMAAERHRGLALEALLDAGSVRRVACPARAVTGLALDSRAVHPGGAFVALAGARAHGLDFLDDALARGATVALVDAGDPRRDEAAAAAGRRRGAVAVRGLAPRVGAMAARLYDQPGRRARARDRGDRAPTARPR
ncbi:MAG: Mur ligase domain-containing protein [Halofilum sp. (in: g-proteobacteria)]|nr:Mur ligase domain-containing protein [Halofilum sp. (in: g-proteobacteria)]